MARRGTEAAHRDNWLQAHRSGKSQGFYEGFFRAVSRLNDGATRCVLALSNKAETGLPQRAKQHRMAWLRIAEAFPELEIWLVDTKLKTYKRKTWAIIYLTHQTSCATF